MKYYNLIFAVFICDDWPLQLLINNPVFIIIYNNHAWDILRNNRDLYNLLLCDNGSQRAIDSYRKYTKV